jgi:hypothetical protein
MPKKGSTGSHRLRLQRAISGATQNHSRHGATHARRSAERSAARRRFAFVPALRTSGEAVLVQAAEADQS